MSRVKELSNASEQAEQNPALLGKVVVRYEPAGDDEAAPEVTILMPCLNESESLERCIRKAQSFLEAALKLSDSEALKVRAHRALASLFEHLGDQEKAARHYRESALAARLG